MLKGEPTLWELAGVRGFCMRGGGRAPDEPGCCRGDMPAPDVPPIEPTLSLGPPARAEHGGTRHPGTATPKPITT